VRVLIAFGLIGIFAGPVLIAVSHTLLSGWADDEIAEPPPPRKSREGQNPKLRGSQFVVLFKMLVCSIVFEILQVFIPPRDFSLG
jgi:hypothetical protein